MELLNDEGNMAVLMGNHHKAKVVADVVANNRSDLQRDRLAYNPPLPKVLSGPRAVVEGEERTCVHDYQTKTITARFPKLCAKPMRVVNLTSTAEAPAGSNRPLRIGVELSGGQAAGGHNVIAGIFDSLEKNRPGSKLFGFLNGQKGVLEGRHIELTKEIIDQYRNQGGFNMIGSGRDKIETPEQLLAAEATCRAMALDGLISIGEDDPNTNTAVLAEHLIARGVPTKVIGVPKTIDGDLKNKDVATSFGFDTACKVYCELIGNVMIDAASAGKYFHFIRLMGRSASHITLECALQTHPQMALVSEEVAASRQGLNDIAVQIADMVQARTEAGKSYGVVLIPEGLIEQVHDVAQLIRELNGLLAEGVDSMDHEGVAARLSPHSRGIFLSMPLSFKLELLLERDPHGNVQVARIATEKLLIRLVEQEIERRKNAGTFKGKFNALSHYFGYEGRCSLPTNFDATYSYALGHTAAELVGAGCTAMMACVFDLHRPAAEWRLGGTPLVSMMSLEWRNGKQKPTIAKAVTDLDGPVMQAFRDLRARWAVEDCFRSVGPIQYKGTRGADQASMTLALDINGGDPVSIV